MVKINLAELFNPHTQEYRKGDEIVKQEKTAPEEVGMSLKRLERIRPVMQGYVDQKKNAGLSTMIVRKGKVVHFEQVGQLD